MIKRPCKWLTAGGKGKRMKETCFIEILRLAAEGKLDRKDFQMLVVMAELPAAGYKMLASRAGLPRHVARYRLAKIKMLFK